MDTLIQDLRFAFRMFLKTRGFTVVAVLTLAAGIGANTAIFSLVNAVLLRQLPFKEPDRLVWIWSHRTDRDKSAFSLPDFIDYRDQNRSLEQISAFTTWSANLLNEGEPERVFGVRSSANIFQTLGVKAIVGRTLVAEDDHPESTPVVVLSYGFWKRRFGLKREIVGKTLTLSDETYVVAGVLSEEFSFPGMEADMVIPLVPDADPLRTERASISFLRVIGRLEKGISLQQAKSDLDSIASHLQKLYPEANASKKGTKVIPLQEELDGNFRLAFLVLSCAVGLVLLIACANLANLVLAKSSTRYREMAVRIAIGATRRRLIRQLFTENTLLALSGGMLGLLLAQPAMKGILSLAPSSLPRSGEIKIDGVVMIFSLLISLFSGVLFGLMPAFPITRQNLIQELKGSGKETSDASGKNRIRNLLILGEVALSLLLLIGAGLLAKSYQRLQSVSPGFRYDHLLVLRLSLPKTQYRTPEAVNVFFDQLSNRIENLPGVKSASATSTLPLSGTNVRINFQVSGRPPLSLSEQPITQYRMIGTDYFRTMNIPFHSGRDFTNTDTKDTQPVAIINNTFAQRYWKGISPIGARIKIDDNNQGPREVEIIGVVGDVRHTGLNEDPTPETYLPITQIPEENVPLLINNMSWIIATTQEPLNLVESIKREIQSINASVATSSSRSMEQILSLSLAPRRFNLFLLGLSAIAALLLASMGIYSLISYSVAQRKHELGIRMALGAQKQDVLKLVIGSALKIVFTGVILGLISAFVFTRFISSLLYEVSIIDISTFAFAPVVFILISLIASYIPARRAANVDPVHALRSI